MNIILNTDSYKASHFLQYPPDTMAISSYIEARGVSKSFPQVDKTVFFGLQAFLKEYLSKPITMNDINEAEGITMEHGVPFNRKGWERVLLAHDGYLPLRIKALPEGSKVPLKTCLVQVYNTDFELPWLTSYIETALLRAVWYPTTVATLSRAVKDICKKYLALTADDLSGLDFMLHDFGARGASSEESAAIGGLAHLVNFKGTDTLSAIMAARKYYNASMPGFSIPAAEHSTITSWGRKSEEAAYANMIEKFGKGLYAVVSDSYDIYNAAENIWGGSLKAKVIEAGGRLVIRPDSGDPVQVVTSLLTILGQKFGSGTNSKGFKVLPPCVRIIQGDGVNPESIDAILHAMTLNGWSAENIVFGMGGALLQRLDRDSLKFAMKASAIWKDDIGVWEDVYKDPVTDPGKGSKRGILEVVGDDFETIRADDCWLTNKYMGKKKHLEIVYDRGKIRVDDTLENIRRRADA